MRRICSPWIRVSTTRGRLLSLLLPKLRQGFRCVVKGTFFLRMRTLSAAAQGSPAVKKGNCSRSRTAVIAVYNGECGFKDHPRIQVEWFGRCAHAQITSPLANSNNTGDVGGGCRTNPHNASFVARAFLRVAFVRVGSACSQSRVWEIELHHRHNNPDPRRASKEREEIGKATRSDELSSLICKKSPRPRDRWTRV